MISIVVARGTVSGSRDNIQLTQRGGHGMS
jgi:hypothetical protein